MSDRINAVSLLTRSVRSADARKLMLPGKTYRVVRLRPNGDRIIVWECLAQEDAVRLHEALIAKSTASSFVIEMDEYQSTVMPIEGALIGHQYLQRRRPQ